MTSMNRNNLLAFGGAALLIAGGGALIWHFKTHQKIGPPGIRVTARAGSNIVEINLPRSVANFRSEPIPVAPETIRTLPKDTSIAQRFYAAPDGFGIALNSVLMGTDRTSIHKPEFCLPGQGWHIDQRDALTIAINGPHPYDLPASRILVSRQIKSRNGTPETVRGVFIYWFVADHRLAQNHWERIWQMTRDLVTTGVLDRWAYVACFSVCRPGFEEVTTERMKQFLGSAVPDFQLATAESTGSHRK